MSSTECHSTIFYSMLSVTGTYSSVSAGVFLAAVAFAILHTGLKFPRSCSQRIHRK